MWKQFACPISQAHQIFKVTKHSKKPNWTTIPKTSLEQQQQQRKTVVKTVQSTFIRPLPTTKKSRTHIVQIILFTLSDLRNKTPSKKFQELSGKKDKSVSRLEKEYNGVESNFS